MKQTVTVLGAGAFGTAISTVLANNNFIVNLWCNEDFVVHDILTEQENKFFLPGIKLSKNIKPTNNLEQAINNSKYIFQAIPVLYLRKILEKSKKYIKQDQVIINLSKGIEQKTLLLPTQIIENVLGKKIKTAELSGPNFAKELAEKNISACIIASKDLKLAKNISKLLSNNYFKTYINNDPIGVQVGGAIKNVLTLLIGITQGANYSANTLAYLLTLGFNEFEKLSLYYKGKEKTIYGLSGLGDLFLCSTCTLSRNLQIGQLIGQGITLEELKKNYKTLPEGINTTKSIYQIIQKAKLDLPVCNGIYQIIFKKINLKNLLNRIINEKKI